MPFSVVMRAGRRITNVWPRKLYSASLRSKGLAGPVLHALAHSVESELKYAIGYDSFV